MNIFYLDKSPEKAAQMQIDKHVVKMVLESAQLLSTCHRTVDGEHYIDASSGRKLQKWRMADSKLDNIIYKATHFNHPCSKWLRESKANYDWLYQHFAALAKEYKKRYGKDHLSYTKLRKVLANAPTNLPDKGFTSPALAILDKYKVDDAVQSYRNYYEGEKLELGKTEDKERYWRLLDE